MIRGISDKGILFQRGGVLQEQSGGEQVEENRGTQGSRAFKYKLEGGMIKVIAIGANGAEKVVKYIPLSSASTAILKQVQASTLLDIILLTEEKQKRSQGDGSSGLYDNKGSEVQASKAME